MRILHKRKRAHKSMSCMLLFCCLANKSRRSNAFIDSIFNVFVMAKITSKTNSKVAANDNIPPPFLWYLKKPLVN